MSTVELSVEVDVLPEDFYEVLIDFERYPDFVPNQTRVTILESGENEWTVEFELQAVKRLVYVLKQSGEPGRSLSWVLLDGQMIKTNIGGWHLSSSGGGTLATYTIDVTLDGFVPRSVSDRLIQNILPRNLEAFKSEAERRQF